MSFQKMKIILQGQFLETDSELRCCNYNMSSREERIDGHSLETECEHISRRPAVNFSNLTQHRAF